jgi:hypothetical protein
LPGAAAIATSALASEAATITCSSSASYILSSLIGSATKLFP